MNHGSLLNYSPFTLIEQCNASIYMDRMQRKIKPVTVQLVTLGGFWANCMNYMAENSGVKNRSYKEQFVLSFWVFSITGLSSMTSRLSHFLVTIHIAIFFFLKTRLLHRRLFLWDIILAKKIKQYPLKTCQMKKIKQSINYLGGIPV